MAADMGAACRMEVQLAGFVFVGGDLLEPPAQDGALTRLQVLKRGDFAWSHILGEVLQNRQILTQEISSSRKRLAVRRVDGLPEAIFAENKRGIQHRAHHTMSETLTGVTHGETDALAAGLAAN